MDKILQYIRNAWGKRSFTKHVQRSFSKGGVAVVGSSETRPNLNRGSFINPRPSPPLPWLLRPSQVLKVCSSSTESWRTSWIILGALLQLQSRARQVKVKKTISQGHFEQGQPFIGRCLSLWRFFCFCLRLWSEEVFPDFNAPMRQGFDMIEISAWKPVF